MAIETERDVLPSVEDLAALHLADAFKAKVKTAVTYLTKQGHGVFLVELLLRTVIEDLREGCATPDVGRVALDVDEAAGQKARRELARRLREAGAMCNADAHTLRQKLSDARKASSGTEAVLDEIVAVRSALKDRNGSDDERKEAIKASLGALDTLIPDMAMVMRLYRLGAVRLVSPDEDIVDMKSATEAFNAALELAESVGVRTDR